MRLIADVGGTNTRMGLSRDGAVLRGTVQSFVNDDWETVYAIVTEYLSRRETVTLAEAVVAVAGPVRDNCAQLTNRDWHVQSGRVSKLCDGVPVRVLNDLTALGYAVPNLSPDQYGLVSSGSTPQTPDSQSLVIGIGTGFNVSPVMQAGGTVICPSVEAGHVGMPFSIARELRKLGFAPEQFRTIEALFSGPGLSAFCKRRAGGTEFPRETAVVANAVEEYSSLLGYLMRDLSLAYMPTAGIYLAGGVARSVMSTSTQSCIEVYRHPSMIAASNTAPVFIITDDAAALAGCAQVTFH